MRFATIGRGEFLHLLPPLKRFWVELWHRRRVVRLFDRGDTTYFIYWGSEFGRTSRRATDVGVNPRRNVCLALGFKIPTFTSPTKSSDLYRFRTLGDCVPLTFKRLRVYRLLHEPESSIEWRMGEFIEPKAV